MADDNYKTVQVMSEKDIANTIRRIAFEILEKYPDQPLAFIGIHSRGVVLSNRVYDILKDHNDQISKGTIDISLYRDDLDNLGSIPSIKGSDIDFDVEGAHIILFDEVIYTGRTIRAALNVITDYGRPAKIELAVLIDRGHREYPIAADYTGLKIQTLKDDYVKVRFMESDSKEGTFHSSAKEQA